MCKSAQFCYFYFVLGCTAIINSELKITFSSNSLILKKFYKYFISLKKSVLYNYFYSKQTYIFQDKICCNPILLKKQV